MAKRAVCKFIHDPTRRTPLLKEDRSSTGLSATFAGVEKSQIRDVQDCISDAVWYMSNNYREARRIVRSFDNANRAGDGPRKLSRCVSQYPAAFLLELRRLYRLNERAKSLGRESFPTKSLQSDVDRLREYYSPMRHRQLQQALEMAAPTK